MCLLLCRIFNLGLDNEFFWSQMPFGVVVDGLVEYCKRVSDPQDAEIVGRVTGIAMLIAALHADSSATPSRGMSP
jgi:hypothetical protein